MANDHTQTAAWLAPEHEQQGLIRYLETVRERWLLIVLAVAVTTFAAMAYVAFAEESFEAEAQLLVTPVSRDNEALIVLGLLRDSSDPTRDVETAALFATSDAVAERAKRRLRTSRSARALVGDIEAAPVAQSNIVTVTATGSSRVGAQRLANAFARGVVEDRNSKLAAQVGDELRGLRGTLRRSDGSAAEALARQIALLEAVRAGGDPTIHVEALADYGSKAWPRPAFTLMAGILAGLVLGVGAAFAAALFDPRLRRESQLRSRFRLPVLARVPDAGRIEPAGSVITPRRLPPAAAEVYRALRATLEATARRRALDAPAREGEGRVVVITGATAGEGKTTTALNLAVALAHSGRRVILIEADLRRPALAQALGVEAGAGLPAVLLDELALRDGLVEADGYHGSLKLLLVGEPSSWMGDQLSLPGAQSLLREARQLADYVIVDSPPIPEVIDPLPLIEAADDVVIVTRLGHTRLGALERLGELLAQAGVTPVGIALIGVGRARGAERYGVGWRTRARSPHSPREREPALRT